MEKGSIRQTLSSTFTVAPNVWGKKDTFVNYYFIKDQTSESWALIDTGLKWSAGAIRKMAKELFGINSRPSAIILTHGHFDHVGSVSVLAREWNVPVYAHPMEMPFLTGRSSYPPADPSVGGGLMASLSFLYPTSPVDISEHLRPLPDDNNIPGFPEWKYIFTPGHSPGHISLFREKDKVLIAGDAFVTTKAESALYALTGIPEISGPPKYLTINWASAKLSVIKLAALDPEIIATGHGRPMHGEEMRHELNNLSRHFDDLATPAHGRYVSEPVVADASGITYIPESQEKIPAAVKTIGIGVALFTIAYLAYRQVTKERDISMVKKILSIH